MFDNNNSSVLAFPTGRPYPEDTQFPFADQYDNSPAFRGGRVAVQGYLAPVEEVSEARKAEFIQAIQVWVGDARQRRAIPVEDLQDMPTFQRMVAIRNAVVANAISICRANPRQDCRMAVLLLVSYLSDNEDLVCWLSIQRMAQILVRKEETVRLAILYLEEHGAISVERVNGLLNAYSANVPVGLDDVGASIAWFADALSRKPGRRGRPPKKNPPGQNGPKLPAPPQNDLNPPVEGAKNRSQPSTKVAKNPPTKVEKTPPVERKNPPGRARQYISKDIAKDLSLTIGADPSGVRIREQQVNRVLGELCEVHNHD